MSTQPGTIQLGSQPVTRKPKVKRHLASFTKHAVLILLGIGFVFPLFWMISTSIKPSFEQMSWPPVWIPHPFDWANYPSSMKFEPFFHYILNTLYYCVATVIGTVLSCSVVAYGFARIEWPERGFLFFLMLATMMLPFQVTMIPLFILFKNIGWVGSFKPLIIPSFFGNAFQIFLLRQFFMTIPKSLSEAAYMDGASEFKIFYKIILPLAKPALATVALFQFMYCWNDFLGPIIYLNNSSLYTISLGLQQYVSSYGTQWGLLMAASTVATLPLIILFFLTQRTFIEGIAITGLKG
ncbi:carbohydrate ABC transporter permease [Alicyclobacillus fastidiosus]|uniref:Carbohydrate ABC transporter permease n=1 Tax=Alicyclobacillus fastidiosus TaxID=392011 RepID=A0ABY6ZHT4_9BACL|nr:carbohydrate ABC transporter permease [Alicyclobacillus fastidiosus]WAH42082.1 carbohydrate ABC transporter permease [Alicyclobacillus fastidiosus]GMA63847.1 sugar ABC transporter permease [Alicyclobacillus fastidiosus]